MNYHIDVLRSKGPGQDSYVQTFRYRSDDPGENVLHVLQTVSSDPDYKDEDGRPVGKIGFECSCLQKRCGACAMRINGRVRLACDARLSDYKKGRILLEPLKKFPVVKDLIVDRNIMQKALKQAEVFRREDISLPGETDFLAQEASRCLQCGCCLEVCPNYSGTGKFAGAAVMAAAARLFLQQSPESVKDSSGSYDRYLYEGCGKSSACQDVCPAGLPLDKLWAHCNAAAVWHRKGRHRRVYD